MGEIREKFERAIRPFIERRAAELERERERLEATERIRALFTRRKRVALRACSLMLVLAFLMGNASSAAAGGSPTDYPTYEVDENTYSGGMDFSKLAQPETPPPPSPAPSSPSPSSPSGGFSGRGSLSIPPPSNPPSGGGGGGGGGGVSLATLAITTHTDQYETTATLNTGRSRGFGLGVGSLSYESVSVEVFVNGESWGTTPVTKQVRPGTYTITFSPHSGYDTPGSQTITLKSGERKTVNGIYNVRVGSSGTIVRDVGVSAQPRGHVYHEVTRTDVTTGNTTKASAYAWFGLGTTITAAISRARSVAEAKAYEQLHPSHSAPPSTSRPTISAAPVNNPPSTSNPSPPPVPRNLAPIIIAIRALMMLRLPF